MENTDLLNLPGKQLDPAATDALAGARKARQTLSVPGRRGPGGHEIYGMVARDDIDRAGGPS